jgi:hypothetical protein
MRVILPSKTTDAKHGGDMTNVIDPVWQLCNAAHDLVRAPDLRARFEAA